MTPAIRLVLAAVAIAALTGCGKTTAAQTVAPIDTVFGKAPAAESKLGIGTAIQEREDGEVDNTETSRVGNKPADATGMRRD